MMCVDERGGKHHSTVGYHSATQVSFYAFILKLNININSHLNNISAMDQQKLSARHIIHMAISPLRFLSACGLYRLGKREHTVITTYSV